MKKEPNDTVETDADTEKTSDIVNVVSVIPDKAEVEAAIRKSVYAAMGIGIVPISIFNFAAVTAIQLKLVRQLSDMYRVEFKEGAAKKIITAMISSAVPAFGSSVLGHAVIGIPIVGLPLAVSSKSLLGAMSTYATGQMFVTHFTNGGTFIGANLDVMKEDFSAAFQNSRKWLGNTISGQKVSEGTVI